MIAPVSVERDRIYEMAIQRVFNPVEPPGNIAVQTANMKATIKMSTESMTKGRTMFATAALALSALALVPATLPAKVIKVPSQAIQTIQEGVDAAGPGDTVLVKPGTYLVESYSYGVMIGPDKPGLKLMASGPPGSVRIVKIDRPDDDYAKGIGIGADNVTVEGFDISGFWSGVYGGAAVPQTQGGHITRNTIHDCASEGIIVTGSSNYEIDHNTVVGNPKVAGPWGQTGIAVGGDPAVTPNAQHHIHHNQVTAAKGDGINLYQAPGCLIDHNVSNNNGRLGIYLQNSPDCTVSHNQTDNNGTFDPANPYDIFAGTGIVLGMSPNCAVTENEASDNVAGGILEWGCDGSSFEHNVAEGNALWDLCANPDVLTCRLNRAVTAYPSLEFWDVKPVK